MWLHAGEGRRAHQVLRLLGRDRQADDEIRLAEQRLEWHLLDAGIGDRLIGIVGEDRHAESGGKPRQMLADHAIPDDPDR